MFPVDHWMRLEPKGLVGAMVADPKRIDIPVGDEAMEVKLPAVLAGSVDGVILRHDGTPAAKGSVRVLEIHAAAKPQRLRINPSAYRNSSRFFQPLPIGGTTSWSQVRKRSPDSPGQRANR